MAHYKVLKPREATKIARRKGWHVFSKRRTGEIVFVDRAGKRYVAQAHGRTNKVPLKLVKALHDDN